MGGGRVSVVSFGGGTNSTALLIGLIARGAPPPHAILFADTGGEHPATYAHLDRFSDWLAARGYPRVTVVWRVDHRGERLTLERNCLDHRMLPSVAYGYKTCSHKFKIQPQDKWCNHDPVLRAEWAAGRRVVKVLGFDADEPHRAKDYPDPKYEYRYPLLDWGWGRAECVAAIAAAGLPPPGKSACFFCPNSKPAEVRALRRDEPGLYARAIRLEANAELTTLKGLGRRFAWRDLAEVGPGPAAACEPSVPCGCYDGADA